MEGKELLTVDLSTHVLGIKAHVSGKPLLLFGSREGRGALVVVVRGPSRVLTVRRKERVLGVWMNRAYVRYGNVPGYYFLASSGPYTHLLSKADKRRYRVGYSFLPVRVQGTSPHLKDRSSFWRGLVRAQQRAGLYYAHAGDVSLRGPHLFRVTIHFPTNAPVGRYTIETLLVQDHKVVSTQTIPLLIRTVGLDKALKRLSVAQPALYAVLVILVVLGAGVTIDWVFKRL